MMTVQSFKSSNQLVSCSKIQNVWSDFRNGPVANSLQDIGLKTNLIKFSKYSWYIFVDHNMNISYWLCIFKVNKGFEEHGLDINLENNGILKVDRNEKERILKVKISQKLRKHNHQKDRAKVIEAGQFNKTDKDIT